jgi:hypothetical protein
MREEKISTRVGKQVTEKFYCNYAMIDYYWKQKLLLVKKEYNLQKFRRNEECSLIMQNTLQLTCLPCF